MASFTYEAVTKDGKTKKDNIEADNLEKAKKTLKGEGYIILKIEEASLLTKDINFSFGMKKKVSSRDLGVFCRQFVSILRAGVSIINALEMLGDQTESKVLKPAIKNIKTSVEQGDTLNKAFAKEEGVFPQLLINMIEAGEASGSLETALERMSIHFEKDAKIKGMVKKAMMYPMVLMVVALGVVVLMLVVVIPQFESMFKDIGSDLPPFTKIVVSLSESLKSGWYIYLIVISMIIGAYKLYANSAKGMRVVAGLKLKIPVFGMLITKTACARFSRTLSTLLASGMPLIEAVDITAKTMDNVLFRDALSDAARQIERGVSLSAPLKNSGLFPSMVLHMLGIGEETGNMDEMLTNVANYYDEEVEITTQQATALMEPLIIVVMAVIVSFLIAAIYTPMMSLYDNIK
jgi:type IV pilus assembly protein PilC